MMHIKKNTQFYILLVFLLLISCSSQKKYNTVKIGMCSDVHLPTMHDSEYRIQTFIDSMKIAKPDFIIELGDFGTPAKKYAGFFDIWNSFPGDKYHVIGNHEMDGGYSRQEAVEYRGMGNSYYSFEKNQFHFIVLDGNDPTDENSKGYKQYIGAEQIGWLKKELGKTKYPVVIFSHQGLTTYPGGEGDDYGLENDEQLREILELHNKQNPQRKVITCFNGHTHYDYAENVNDIWYITINSMSYRWMGEAFTNIRYSREIDEKFKWIKYTAPHKEPLFTIVEISTKGYIKIDGKQTEWEGPSPWELGYPKSLKKYVRPAISKRFLKFNLGNTKTGNIKYEKKSSDFYEKIIVTILLVIFIISSCNQQTKSKSIASEQKAYKDTHFVQEFHDAYYISGNKADNEVRSIEVDKESNVWIATASGVFRKENGTREWNPIILGENRGPAYSVVCNPDGAVLMGTWNGIYRFHNQQLRKEEGVKPPISVICKDHAGNYALGPYGIWHSNENKWEYLNYKIARSVRDAMVDEQGNLFVATNAGLYRCNDGEAILYQDTSELISCYVQGISTTARGEIWAGVMGGVSIRKNNKLVRKLTPEEGIPSVFVNCISQSPQGVMWIGTNVGIVRYEEDGSHSIRFSKRWLTNNKVNDIAFDKAGNAWIATANGVSAIKRLTMTLAEKEKNYYNQMMKKHIRTPWICGNLRLEVSGDTSTWRNSDDDNDGEYTGGYMAMESFRYAVTKDEDALIKARKAFDFLCLLQDVTETDGFFARTIVPSNWTKVHDANRSYSTREIVDLLVREPRYKPVEKRWRPSKDGKWLWKGDTSSDEMTGHMMGYFFFYEYAAGEQDKELIREHVRKIIDQLIKTNYNLIDIDGKATRWGVWSPDNLNRDPDWSSEKSLNSFELLAYLKFASHITGDEKYEREYRRLIDEEGYLKNTEQLNKKNPAWQIYFDLTLEGYLFPILLKYEKDPELKKYYENLIDEWIENQTAGENLINNLTYALVRGKKVNTKQTIDFLRDSPLDLVDWRIDHTLREDVKLVREPILEELQISELPAASERATVRWDKNPWAAIHGNPAQVREPVFWLWPYWMARYLEIIK